MRNIKSIILGISIAIAILLTFAISMSLIFEEEVSQYLVEELNEILLSEIEVEEVSFSVLRKFPKATLEFKNVTAFTKTGYRKKIKGLNTDTLFHAKSIFVQMDLSNIFSKNYTINTISFDQGQINLFTDHLGDPNYIFWEIKPEEQNENFNLELTEVNIVNTDIVYCNEVTDLLINAHADKIDFEGNFSRQNYLMKIKSALNIRELSVKNTKYVENKKLKAKIELDIINNLISIKQGYLNLQNLKFDINGNIENSESLKTDLAISGNNLHLPTFVKYLPSDIKKEMEMISFQSGNITLKLNISGENTGRDLPHIEALFLISDAQLFEERTEFRIDNINIDGLFNNGEFNSSAHSEITFKSFDAAMESNSFSGDFKLKNLVNPYIELNMDTELKFSEIKEIFDLDTLEVFEGDATANIAYNGTYTDLKNFTFSDLFTKDFVGGVQIDNGEFKFKNNPVLITEISGELNLRNTLHADSIYFEIGENDFLINGRISKLYEYFNESQIININAKLYSEKTNLNELAPLFETKSETGEDASYRFPDKLAMQLRLNIKNLELGKFNATNVKGNMNYKPGMFSLHQIAFNSMNGNVKAGGVILQKQNNDFHVKTQCRLSSININNLFYSLNNFGQEFITNKNLGGSITGDVYFTSEWSDKIEVYKETVVSDCDITITNGELNDFEPMMGLSRFIDVDELKSIKFSELKNKITINDEKIEIPQMDIKSSALNIIASGEHNFDNTYSYHMQVLLSDLLSGKRKRAKKKRLEGEVSQEDDEGRITLYLRLEGDSEDSKVRYDRKAARAVRKESMKEEKSELKDILNDEFGWYKGDSTVNQNYDIKDSQNNFEIEFEETKQEKKKKKDIESEEKFEIEWEEDTTNINNR
jgi:AsmA-like C-terminal region